MNRQLVSAFMLVAALATNSITLAQSAQDSLLDRIRGTKHIGIRTDDALSGYVLYLYTQEQRAANLSELAAFRKDFEAYRVILRLKRYQLFAPQTVPVGECSAASQAVVLFDLLLFGRPTRLRFGTV